MNTVHASITREKYKTTIVTDNKHTLVADEPITAGGENLGMTPGQLLASSIISCTAITLRMYADRKEWPLEKIDISITYEKKEDKTVFYKKLNDHVGYMVVQDPSETNVKLKKSGLSLDELSGRTIPEIANVLGVEYVVKTILTIDKQGARTYNNSSGRVNKTNRGLSSYSSSSSSTTIQYKTVVDVNVYNDHGENTFTRSKMSFLTSQDAYPLTMGFLTKKMPFYTK